MLALLKQPLLIILVVLSTLLLGSAWLNKQQAEKLSSVEDDLVLTATANKTLAETVERLQDEIENNTEKFIQITREVSKEVCDGESASSAIQALPPMTITVPKVKGGEDEKSYVDIDGLLPPALLERLQ